MKAECWRSIFSRSPPVSDTDWRRSRDVYSVFFADFYSEEQVWSGNPAIWPSSLRRHWHMFLVMIRGYANSRTSVLRTKPDHVHRLAPTFLTCLLQRKHQLLRSICVLQNVPGWQFPMCSHSLPATVYADVATWCLMRPDVTLHWI